MVHNNQIQDQRCMEIEVLCELIFPSCPPFSPSIRYCRDNPGIFKTADTAYVLAYAVIMLNTDAHNPVVTAKMTKADFVRINSGGEGEEGAPVDLLEKIYDSILANEITLSEEIKGVRKGDHEKEGSLLDVLNLAAPRKRHEAENHNVSGDEEKVRAKRGEREMWGSSKMWKITTNFKI